MKVLQIEGFNNIDLGTVDYEEEHTVLYNFFYLKHHIQILCLGTELKV